LLTIRTGTLTPPESKIAGVAIDVADTGVGIPPETQSRIFDLFFTTKPQGRGTGMGLSICQEIVKMHGGKIVVTSEMGKGTCMRVLLLADAAERTNLTSTPLPESSSSSVSSPSLSPSSSSSSTSPLIPSSSEEQDTHPARHAI
jgi:histidine kinase/DNA gyrase B/HSP90-like ATPase